MSAITYRAWGLPTPRAALLLIHGLGANPDWWECAAVFFLKDNFSSYAIDLRQYGSFKEFFLAVRELHGRIKKENPDNKIFAIGESMGAIIALSMALKDKNIFDGLVCLVPAFKSKAPLNLVDYFKIFLPIFYNPRKQYRLPLTPDMVTRDPHNLKMIESTYDKDVLSTSRVLLDIFLEQICMRFFRICIEKPLLFLVAGDDLVTSSEASKKVFKSIVSTDKKIIEYPLMYHSLSMELGREKVFEDILDWRKHRI